MNIFQVPDYNIPQEPARFPFPPEPLPNQGTLLDKFMEREPFPIILGSEPEEEEENNEIEDDEIEADEIDNIVEEVTHSEAIRRLSQDIDYYIDAFIHQVPFRDITSSFMIIGREGKQYMYLTHNDFFQFVVAVAYVCLRLKLANSIPPFDRFYRIMSKLLRDPQGGEISTHLNEVVTLVNQNGITNIYDLMRAYSDLYINILP